MRLAAAASPLFLNRIPAPSEANVEIGMRLYEVTHLTTMKCPEVTYYSLFSWRFFFCPEVVDKKQRINAVWPYKERTFIVQQYHQEITKALIACHCTISQTTLNRELY